MYMNTAQEERAVEQNNHTYLSIPTLEFHTVHCMPGIEGGFNESSHLV